MSRDLDEDSDDSLPPFSVLMGSTKVMRPPSQSSSLAGSNLSSLDEISISNGEEMELDVTIPIRIRNHSLSSLSDTEDSLRGRMSRLSHETGENPPVTSLLQKGEVAAERVKRQCQQTIMESFDGENLFTNDNCKQINLMEMRRNFVIALSKLKQPQKGFRKIIDRVCGPLLESVSIRRLNV